MSASSSTPRRRSQFRPCIDLHHGQVKQIVGGTLDLDAEAQPEASTSALQTNFVSLKPSSYYAQLYRSHNLTGGHIIKLGPGNDEAAAEAVEAWPSGMQLGGGITDANALEWIEKGAEKVIVTSWLFPEGRFDLGRLQKLEGIVGRERLVVDISCRRRTDPPGWVVAMNGWKTLTDTPVTRETVALISQHCSELLVHAADVEGLCQGIDEELVRRLGEWVSIPCTYAGGARDISDLDLVDRLSEGKVDITFGSCLDIFGGSGVKFDDLVRANDQARRLSEQV